MQRLMKKYSDYVATLSGPGRVFTYSISFFLGLYVLAVISPFFSIFSLVFIGWLLLKQWNKYKGSNSVSNWFNGQSPPPPPPAPPVNPMGHFPQPPQPGSPAHPQTGAQQPSSAPPSRPTIDWKKP